MKYKESPKRLGKSFAMKILEEEYLNAGKTVVVVDRDGTTVKKRKKHLTSLAFTPREGGKS